MRTHAAAIVVVCLLSLIGVGCQTRPTMTESTTLPTATPIPAHTSTPTSAILPTITPTAYQIPAPTPTLTSLTDTEAIAMVEHEVAARGVDLQTLRITIAGDPRSVSIRYLSPYDIEGSVFKVQSVLIGLSVARVAVRLQPPLTGGIRLAVIPSVESEVGLKVTFITGSSLEAWAVGSITDQEFVSQWTVGTVTRE